MSNPPKIQAYGTLSARVPSEMVDAVKAVVERRAAEEPWRRYSLGDAMRELLTKGLEVVAKEAARK